MLGLALRQNHVDAPAVHVDHLQSLARPGDVISRLRQFVQLREDEPGQGHVVARGRLARSDELHHLGEGNGGIDEVGAVLALRHFEPRRDVDLRQIAGNGLQQVGPRDDALYGPNSSTTIAAWTGVFRNRSSVRRMAVDSWTMRGGRVTCSTSGDRPSKT